MLQVTEILNHTLCQAKEGSIYKISEIEDRFLALKLMEMGCMKGMLLEKLSSAPLRGPVLIKVLPNENLLALRYEEAEKLILTKSDN